LSLLKKQLSICKSFAGPVVVKIGLIISRMNVVQGDQT